MSSIEMPGETAKIDSSLDSDPIKEIESKTIEAQSDDTKVNGKRHLDDQDSNGAQDMSSKRLKLDKEGDLKKSFEKCVSNTSKTEIRSTGESVPTSDTNGSLDAKSVDSDKENAVVDLSHKSSSVTSDVIMLSDDDESQSSETIVYLFNGEVTEEKLIKRKQLIRTLQESLRNEEAKLVLLKKIRQSQLMQQLQEPHPPSNKIAGISSQRPNSSSPQLSKAPGKMLNNQPSRNLPHNIQNMSKGGPPPLVTANRSNVSGGIQQSNRSNQQTMNGSGNLSSGVRHSSQQSSRTSAPAQPEQTPAQRQAAAKLALRKQLEKTLLQIPPPKPPPPEMNFIPGLAGNEFIMLIGLEDVVKHITDNDSHAKGEKDIKYVFNPFTCVQCGTDFTPVWKRDKPGSKNVICEQCVTSNQKKALKQEHTNRLKSAFVKALQQEQEIEQRMQQQQIQHQKEKETKEKDQQHHRQERAAEQAKHELKQQQAAQQHQAQQQQQHAASLQSNLAAAQQVLAAQQALVGMGLVPMNLSTSNMKPTSEQIRQHQQLLDAHQRQLRAAAAANPALNFNHRGLPFPFQPMSSKDAAALQRQYLLDLIPSRSGQGAWKS